MNQIDAYRYLAALEQHRHFARAAVACPINQPALSNALRALETHLGVAIVRRGRHHEGLTEKGVQVLTTAHRMLHEQEARQDLARRAVRGPGTGLCRARGRPEQPAPAAAGGGALRRAQPLVTPDLRTPLGFMHAAAARPSLALQAALALAADTDWLAEAQAHSGALRG